MKTILEFNFSSEADREHYNYASKAIEMAGLIDSFLDYMSLMAGLPLDQQPSLESVYSMYRSKIMLQGLLEVIEPDLQYVLKGFEIPIDD